MKLYHRKRWKSNSFGLVSCAFMLLLSIIPVRLAIASSQAPDPQAILTLVVVSNENYSPPNLLNTTPP
jgi:hypothetical protein